MEAVKEKILTDVFYELKNINEGSLVHSCIIKEIHVNKETRGIRLFLKSASAVCFDEIKFIEEAIIKTYSFSSVEILVKFPEGTDAEAYLNENIESIVSYICTKFPSANGFLKGAEYEISNFKINILAKYKGCEILNDRGLDRKIEDYLSYMFSAKINVCIKCTNSDSKEWESQKEEFEKKIVRSLLEEQSETRNRPQKQNNSAESKPEISKPVMVNERDNSIGEKKKIQYKRKSIANPGGPVKTEDGETVLLGRNFEGKYTDISEITIDSGKVSFRGQIFNVETREISNGTGLLVTFQMTDFTNSVVVKFFGDIGDKDYVEEVIRKGIWVRVYGEAQFDNFTKSLSVKGIYIVQYEPEVKKDLCDEKRVELHMHTQMSSMDGLTSVSEIIKRAAKWGHKAIAITDHGVVQAYPEAFQTVSGRKPLDIKLIFGVECYLADDSKAESLETFNYKEAKTYHTILLVKNLVGLKNLYRLISESHINYYYKRPRMPKKLIEKYREGILIGSACEAGELFKAVYENNPDLHEIASFYDYFEIQPIGNNEFMIRNGMVKDRQDLIDLNKRIVELADEMGKMCVATCDVHFLDPRDEVFRRILMAGQGFQDADKQAPLYFRTTDEMLKEFDYLGEEKAREVVITNTNRIADMIENIRPVPAGTFSPSIDGAEEDIRRLSEEKAKSIYGDPLPTIVSERLEKELNSIIKNGFSVMYMIAQKLVTKSLSDGYLVGSRGSVGSSLVANMSGITEVNSLPAHYICPNCKYSEFITDGSVDCGFDLPDKDCPVCGEKLNKDGYDIPFETFLGFDGDKAPDIDLNFSGEYQSRAHKYTEELFGEGHVFRAGTIATVADKTAYGFVKKYYEAKEQNVCEAEINRLAIGCTGVKRTTGQHPGGVIVVPHDKDIYDFTPIQRPADDVGTDIITTHFDFHFLHDTLLKLDILGHDDPTMIRMLEDLTGVSARTIPMGEEKVMSLFRGTEALGVTPEDIDSKVGSLAVPEFGTPFVRQMLVDTKPEGFSDLIRISGLSHGTDVWLNNAQDLIKSNTCTLSQTICCRDDIMIYLIHAGLEPKTSFKIMEDVRKGKGLKEEYVEEMKKNNVPDWYIDSCNKIKYMFPKAHAAAYVTMACRIAWYKIYKPEAFYAAFFTVRADEFNYELCAMGRDKLKEAMAEIKLKGKDLTAKDEGLYKIMEVANEMYARGFEFLPIDLYKSSATKFIIEDGKLRPPFNAIQGLGGAAAENIVAERSKETFFSVEDLKTRAKLSKTVVDTLRNFGCLDGLTETNQLTLF